MKEIHVECNPDEALAKKLGFTRKKITHHSGKSRVFKALSKANGELAIVDEDPGSPKHPYEKQLDLKQKKHGVAYYEDKNQNRIFVLHVKLEEWIISLCKHQGIDLKKYNLADKPNSLHREINQKLPKFDLLLKDLLERESPGLVQLREWLR